MTLASGSRLGQYETICRLEAAGWGERYRARDTKLGRDVEIEILPEQLAQDPERLERLQREARAASGLNHPNVMRFDGLESLDNHFYVVRESLEGKTLRDRLANGPLAVPEAIDYALQITLALHAAHQMGVVYRSLSPNDVIVTPSGQAKIGFGLANLIGPSADGETVGPATEPGTVLGTLGYMSPEQVRGERADARADIFALGAILYEMLTGRKAFGDWNSILQKDAPSLVGGALLGPQPILAALDHVVRTCLVKDPDLRWQRARDLKRELEWIREQLSEGPAAAVPPGSNRRRRERAVWSAAILAVAMLAPTVAERISQQVGRLRDTKIVEKGLALHYPRFWRSAPRQPGSADPISLNNFDSAYGQGGIRPGGGAEVHITAVPLPASLTELIAKELAGAAIETTTDITVGGRKATQITYLDTYGPEVRERNVAVYVPNGSRVYKFFLSYYAGDSQERTILANFQQLLARVRFTPYGSP